MIALSLALGVGLSVALAQDPTCDGDPDAWITRLRAEADRQTYLCLAMTEAAHDPLLAAAQAALREEGDDPGEQNRLTRALAVHLLQRLDRALTGDEVRALNAADRRLLSDGVRARRGRRTPSPEHERVFSQFSWYQPVDGFNNGLLTDQDRANITLLDDPPPVPVASEEAAPAAQAVAQATEQGAQVPRGVCGCATGAGGGWAWLVGLVAVVGLRRRA